MPDLREALINGFGSGFDKQAEQLLNSTFMNNRDSWVKSATENYVKYNVNPNESLAKLAATLNLNDEQIKRLVEETNVSIYLRKYASLKSGDKRDVVFPLADFDVIRPGTDVGTKEASTNKASAGMAKVASFKPSDFSIDNSVSVDCFNSYTAYEPSVWDNIDKVAGEVMRRTLLSAICEEEIERASREKNFVNKVASIGNALIYAERLGDSAQALLDKLAYDADFYGVYQLPVLRYVDKSIAMQKEASRLPDNFIMSLSFSQPPECNPYALGTHSLLEKSGAEVVVNVDKLPENMNYDQMIEFAKIIKQELDNNPPPKGVRKLDVEEVL